MSGTKRYDSMRHKISRGISATKSMLNDCRKQLATLQSGLANLDKSLLAIPRELPTKRSKKGIFSFTKLRGPASFDDYEPELTPNWETLSHFFVPVPGSQIVQFNLSTTINDAIENLYTDYTERMKRMKEMTKAESDKFRDVQDARSKSYAAYRAYCGQIEDLVEKTSPQNLVGRQPEVVKKWQDQLVLLKKGYKDVYEGAVEKMREFNVARVSFGMTIEVFMSAFQDADKMVYERLAEIAKQMREMLDQYLAAKQMTGQNFCTFMSQFKPGTDFDQFVVQQELMSGIPVAEPKQVVTTLVPIPFNLCDVLGPDKVFGKELQYYEAIVVKDFVAKKTKEVDIVKGQVVTVRKTFFKSSKIVNHETHKMGEVPASCLKKITGRDRQLARVAEDYISPETGVQLLKGEIVMTTAMENGMVRCQTQSMDAGCVPVSVFGK